MSILLKVPTLNCGLERDLGEKSVFHNSSKWFLIMFYTTTTPQYGKLSQILSYVNLLWSHI